MYPVVPHEFQSRNSPVQTSHAHNLDIGQKTCKSKRKLQSHYAGRTKRKGHICNVCQKRFTRKNHLQAHYLIHTGDKPHVCDICSKHFRHKSNLRNHKLTHYRQKSHVCDICKQGFTKNQQLKRHYITHSSGKIYICKICNKVYVQKSHLNNHYLVHSRDQEDNKILKSEGKKVENEKKEVIFQICKDGDVLRKHTAEYSDAVEQQEIEKGRVPIFHATDREHFDVTSADCNSSQDPILLQSESQVCLVSAQAVT